MLWGTLQVTPAMFAAIAAGQAASSVLCAANQCHLRVIDVGIDSDVQHIPAGPARHITALHNKVSQDRTEGGG